MGRDGNMLRSMEKPVQSFPTGFKTLDWIEDAKDQRPVLDVGASDRQRSLQGQHHAKS